MYVSLALYADFIIVIQILLLIYFGLQQKSSSVKNIKVWKFGRFQKFFLLYILKNLEDYNIERTADMQNQDYNENLKHMTFDYNQIVQRQALNQRAAPDDTFVLDNIVFTDQPILKVFCHDCRKQLNRTTSILSANSIYRCVGCFAKHQPSDKPYQVIKSLNFPLIDHNWKAYHEILFLNFLQKHGFNNWADIREQMEFYGAKFTVSELENHYYECYLVNDQFLPKILNNDNFFQKKQEVSYALKSAINTASILTLPSTHREEFLQDHYDHIEDNQIESQIRPKKGAKKQKEPDNTLEFYNEKRKEFDIEYDPDAEFMLSNLEFRDDDTEEEKRIKFKIIGLYNQRLEKRNQIKHFVIEHHLLDQNFQKEKNKFRTDLEKEAFEQLKPVARFTSFSEYNELVQKVAFTKQLKSVIEGLRKFRRTHPSNFKSLDQFMSSQPEESKPKKKAHCQNGIKTGKKVEQLLQRRFNLSKKEFQNIVSVLTVNGKKTVYKNIQAVMLQRNYE